LAWHFRELARSLADRLDEVSTTSSLRLRASSRLSLFRRPAWRRCWQDDPSARRDEVASISPGIDAPFAAGVDDAEAGGVEPAALVRLVPKLMRRAMTACRSARSASLFVGDNSGSATKAITGFQSLRTSARAHEPSLDLIFVALAAPLMRASRRVTAGSRCASPDPVRSGGEGSRPGLARRRSRGP